MSQMGIINVECEVCDLFVQMLWSTCAVCVKCRRSLTLNPALDGKGNPSGRPMLCEFQGNRRMMVIDCDMAAVFSQNSRRVTPWIHQGEESSRANVLFMVLSIIQSIAE